MNLYEIDKAILECIDPDTGEVDVERFDELNIERDTKIENILLWHKQLIAEAKAIREEEIALADRRKAKENKAESLKNYIASVLDGTKFETSKVSAVWRKSASVELSEDFAEWAEAHGHNDLLVYKCDASKALIKQAIKDGVDLNGKATLFEKQSMSVK